MTKLEVQDLRVRYGRGHNALTAVDGVSFTVESGSTLGLVGESGCGKSTIARALLGLAPVVGGSITLGGTDCTAPKMRASRAYRSQIQMVFQDPHSSLNPRMTIGRTLSDALVLRGAENGNRADRRKEILRLLELVGLPVSSVDRYPHQFSGGQKQRVAIARALATGADFIVHDEVTSALDVSVQSTVLNLLKELQRELGLTYIFISHDLSVVRTMSDDVAVMYLGRIVERGERHGVFDDPAHPYTEALFESLPTIAGERRSAPLQGELPDPRNPPSGCRFHTRCPIGPLFVDGRSICMSADPTDGADGRRNRAACHFVNDHEVAVSTRLRGAEAGEALAPDTASST